MTSRGFEELKLEYHLQAEDRLVRRFENLGLSRAEVEDHLGYPLDDATRDDYGRLEDYLSRAEAAHRKNRRIPRLGAPARKPTIKR